MSDGQQKVRWETPVLEKIDMSLTANCPAESPQSNDKNNVSNPESGKCGGGMGS